FLRCLALILVALALSRPTLDSAAAPWVGEQSVGMVIAVDASYSMAHGEHSRFERATEICRQIGATAREGDPLSLVLMSTRPRVLLRRAGFSPQTFEETLEKTVEPTVYRSNLEQNLSVLQELVEELKTPARECYLVTDAQEADWSNLSSAALSELERLASVARVFIVPVTIEGDDNLSLQELSFESGSLRVNGVARFVARVRNEGRRATDGGTIEFSVNGALATRRSVGRLEAGETRPVSFFASFETAGDTRISARLSKDELTIDNDRYAVATIVPQVRVLCADGRLAGGNERSGAYYAVRALRLRGARGAAEEGDTSTSIQVQHIDAADLSLETLKDYGVLVLCDVADVAPEMKDRIDKFVRSGGGLIVFSGANVDSAQYNTRFGDLLPAELGEALGATASAGVAGADDAEEAPSWTLASVPGRDPLSSIATRLPEGLLETARIDRLLSAKLLPGAELLLSVPEASNAPLLVRKDVGDGTVLLFTTSADRSWNQLPIHPIYAMVLQQAVAQLSDRSELRHLTVGASSRVAVSGQADQPVEIVDPSGGKLEGRTAPGKGQVVCAVEPELPGFYELSARDAKKVSVAVNVDAVEAGVRVVDRAALSKSVGASGAQVLAPSELAVEIENSRQGRELADVLLALGVLCFLLQSFIAKRFTDRMSRGDADVGATLQMSRVAAARRS
ncbi:MAG: VWA domain-containing protein, partial [Planctomycetota bacterium]